MRASWRQGSARHARGLDAGKEERAHEVGRRLADDAAGEIGDHDALFRHGVLEMQRALGLADDVQDRGGEEEGVDFVQDRIDRLLAVIIAPAVEALLEEGAGQGIGDARDDAGAKISIGEKPRQKRKRGVRRFDERHDRMAQNLFEPRAPHVDPDGAHAGDDAVGDDGALIGARVFEDVEADGIGAVRQIDIADLVVARRRHERERSLGEVAVRIDDEESIASRDVLADDVEEKGGLADAGRAEDRHVAKPLVARERHGLAVCRLTDVGMRGHSRDCLRGPRYGSWGNRLSACYAETTPDMDREAFKRLRSPLSF